MKMLNFIHRERFNQIDLFGYVWFGMCVQAGSPWTGAAVLGGTFVLDVIIGTIISMRARP